jgi:hypothetical protein
MLSWLYRQVIAAWRWGEGLCSDLQYDAFETKRKTSKELWLIQWHSINKETRYVLIYYHRVKYNNDALCWNWRKSCISRIALNPYESRKEQKVVL